MTGIIEYLSKQSKFLLLASAFVLVLVLGVVDYVTAPDLSFLVFYLVPIFLASWFVSRTAGIAVSIAGTLAWFLANLAGTHSYSHPIIPYLNLSEKLVFFVVATYILSAMQTACEAQRRIAEILQENLMRPVPKIEGLDIAVSSKSAFEAARVGGDFYDIFELDGNLAAVLIGDVSGKGIEAAGLIETIRSSVRTLAYINPAPSFVLSGVNESLLRQIPADAFATAAFIVIDRASKEIWMGNAGHPPAVICGHACRFLNISTGSPLGLFAESYEESHLRLEKDEIIFLYTDGLTEARGDTEFFGEERLIERLSSEVSRKPRQVVDDLLESVVDFTAGRLSDDIAIVAVCFCEE